MKFLQVSNVLLTIPNEWNIKGAYIEDSLGHKIVDFKNSNAYIEL